MGLRRIDLELVEQKELNNLGPKTKLTTMSATEKVFARYPPDRIWVLPLD